MKQEMQRGYWLLRTKKNDVRSEAVRAWWDILYGAELDEDEIREQHCPEGESLEKGTGSERKGKVGSVSVTSRIL